MFCSIYHAGFSWYYHVGFSLSLRIDQRCKIISAVTHLYKKEKKTSGLFYNSECCLMFTTSEVTLKSWTPLKSKNCPTTYLTPACHPSWTFISTCFLPLNLIASLLCVQQPKHMCEISVIYK